MRDREIMTMSRTVCYVECDAETEGRRQPPAQHQTTTIDVVRPFVRPKLVNESRLNLALGIYTKHCHVELILIRIGPINLDMKFK